MKFYQRALTRIDGAVLLALALIGLAAGLATGNTTSDSEQLIANEKAWAKAPLDGDADRMANYMAEEYLELAWEPATQAAPAHWSSTTKKEWVESVRHRT